MKNNSLKYPLIFLFLVYPLASFPLIIKNIKNKKYAIVLFSLFMGMLAYISIPLISDDLTRHFYLYESFKSYSFSDFILFLYTKTDYSLSIITYFFSKIGISKQFLPFISVFFGYYLKLLIVHDFYKENKDLSKNLILIIFGIFILSIDFRGLVLGIRNNLAITILTYGIYVLMIKNQKRGWCFIILSSLIHSMTLILIPIILLNPRNQKSKLPRIIFIFSFIFLFITSTSLVGDLINFSANLFGGNIQATANSYTTGYYALDYIDDTSVKGLLAQYINWLPLFCLYFYLLLTNNKSRLRNLIYILSTLTNFLFCFPNLFGRYGGIITSIFVLILLQEYLSPMSLFKKRFILIFSSIILFQFISMLYSMRQTIIKSYPKMLYQSTLTIFFNSVTEKDYIIK